MKKMLFTLLFMAVAIFPVNADTISPSPVPIVLTSTLLAALISAGVSAFVAVRLKDKEYKNDYYKKILEKRLKAIEAAEVVTSIFMLIQGIGSPLRDCYVYLVDELDSDKFGEAIRAASEYNFWYSGETLVAVRRLTLAVRPVEKEAKRRKEAGASHRELQEFAMLHFAGIEEAVEGVGISLAKDMSTLDDVKRFFKAKLNGLPR